MSTSRNDRRSQYAKLQAALHRMGLPRRLLQLIREGVLNQKIEEAYKHLDALNERMDAWEAANPSLAAQTPWHEGREAWKAQGRPRPPWYEALRWHEETARVALSPHEVTHDLLCSSWKPEYAVRYGEKLKARKAAEAQ